MNPAQVQTILGDRAGNEALVPGAIRTQRMSWSTNGGPEEAEIEVAGSSLGIWKLIELLRGRVRVLDGVGDPVWWGFIHTVQILSGGRTISISLDNLYNRVAVVYSYTAPGATVSGERRTTAWAVDSSSVTTYGYRELRHSASGLTDAAAIAIRDTLLEQLRLPSGALGNLFTRPGSPAPRAGAAIITARLYCRGWLDTLSWRMYANASTAQTDTTAQIASLVTACGQFMTGTTIAAVSGVLTSAYRSGDLDGLTELNNLLAMGGTNRRMLLATVTSALGLSIAEEPARTASIVITEGGQVVDFNGIPMALRNLPVGQWVSVNGLTPLSVDDTKIVSPALQFVERANWQEDGRIELRFRGQPGINDILKVGR